jgi:hypothetical protein
MKKGDTVSLTINLNVINFNGLPWYTISRHTIGVVMREMGNEFVSVQFGEGTPHIAVESKTLILLQEGKCILER